MSLICATRQRLHIGSLADAGERKSSLVREVHVSVRSFAVASAALLFASAASVHAQKASERWGPGPPSLPRGTRMAIISGDPARAGPFTIRLELPDGFTV